MAGENDTHQGFDDEGIVNFLFYTFLLNPICHYILSPARKWKRSTAIYLVAGFISFIALSNLYLMLVDSGLNHYQLLEVTRSSSVIDIRKSYKKLILEVHPDKNPNPAAPEQVRIIITHSSWVHCMRVCVCHLCECVFFYLIAELDTCFGGGVGTSLSLSFSCTHTHYLSLIFHCYHVVFKGEGCI